MHSALFRQDFGWAVLSDVKKRDCNDWVEPANRGIGRTSSKTQSDSFGTQRRLDLKLFLNNTYHWSQTIFRVREGGEGREGKGTGLKSE